MITKINPNIDRSSWGEGPWTGEPDKAQWTDETTGLDCLIVRNTRAGNFCGYVGVTMGHPLYKVDYSDVDSVGVHGGLTFSEGCDTEHAEFGICHVPAPGAPDDVWWFGFDCHHYDDFAPGGPIELPFFLTILGGDDVARGETYREFDWVRAECASLAAQLAKARYFDSAATLDAEDETDQFDEAS